MAFGYIGRSNVLGIFQKQVLVPNGTTTDFLLDFQVASSNSILVVYGGVVQEPGPGNAYAVAQGGKRIQFSFVPQTGVPLYIVYLGRELAVPRTVGNEPVVQQFTATASQTVHNVGADGPVDEASIMVFVDNQMLRPFIEYTVVNNVDVTFTTPFSGGEEVDIYFHGKERTEFDSLQNDVVTTNAIADLAVTNEKINLTWKTDWTPVIQTFDGMLINNLTIHHAKYIVQGKKVDFDLRFTCEFTTALSNRVRFSLPVDNNGDISAGLYGSLSTTTVIEQPVGVWGGVDEFDIYRNTGVDYTLSEEWDIKVKGTYEAA